MPKTSLRPGMTIQGLTLMHQIDAFAPQRKGRLWQVQCACGSKFFASPSDIRSGRVVDCGCATPRKYRNRPLVPWQVDPASGCYVWASVSSQRSARPYLKSRRLGIQALAYRVIYEVMVGPIPDGAHLLHSCDNPACVNPAHLRVGTHADNMRDMAERNRCMHGESHYRARLTSDNVAQIKRRLRLGESVSTLAVAYSVDQSTVSKIKIGAQWRRVEPANDSV